MCAYPSRRLPVIVGCRRRLRVMCCAAAKCIHQVDRSDFDVHNTMLKGFLHSHEFQALHLKKKCFLKEASKHSAAPIALFSPKKTPPTRRPFSSADYPWKCSLPTSLFPRRIDAAKKRDVIDNDIEIDCLNPLPQFKVPKQIIYIHAIQCRDGSWQELPIDK